MNFTSKMTESLSKHHRTAAEINCVIPECREFCCIHHINMDSNLQLQMLFPYYSEYKTVFRVIRFNVSIELLENENLIWDGNIGNKQEVWLPTVESVLYLLRIWNVQLELFSDPNSVEYPL